MATAETPREAPADLRESPNDYGVTKGYIVVALIALFGGVLMGLFQALERAGINVYPHLTPFVQSYYHGLTIHGVLNALVWTTFFISGFLSFITVRSLGRPLASYKLSWGAFWLMVAGLVIAAIPLLGNAATVMFTFYPPMKAHWAFYIGLTLVVVATWLVTLNLVQTYRGWRREHPGERTPLPAFMSLVTFVMWTIASLGIAAEMLFMMIPWSLGLAHGTDALLARVLFWYTGHPIVYFWILPAYVSWYTLVPRQAGGKLYSDPLARVAFLMFLVLSTPLGFHHQFADPGIGEGWKFVHALITFAVFFPSLMTFFNVMASLESGGRARGGRGFVMWFFKLPWGDPSLAAQLLAMFTFTFGGIGGLINASFNLNTLVHNTTWMVGHLHLTIGTAGSLTYIGVTYWLVPALWGRKLWSRGLALAQAWLWAFGMLIFSHAGHALGLFGMPRRTMISGAPYLQSFPEWKPYLLATGIGGAILFVSAMLYFLNMVLTMTVAPRTAPVVPEFAEAISGADEAPPLLDRWGVWLSIGAALIVIAYGPVVYHLLMNTPFDQAGFRVW
jgi:cytochrome c oxidase subunit 1